MMQAELMAKVEGIIGKILSVDVLEDQGCTSEVRRLFTEDTTYLLKSSYKEKYREWVREEANKLECLNRHPEVPVPTYCGLIDEEDSTHLVMSFERGITLTSALKYASSQAERSDLIQSFGKFLQQFHERLPVSSIDHKRDWLQEQLLKAKDYVLNNQTDGTLELLDELTSNKPKSIKQTMIHGDCTTDNVLVQDGEVQLFIDIGGMSVGDPRYDEALAIRKFINSPEDMDAFYRGYTRYKVSRSEYAYFEEGLYEFF